MTVSMPSLQLLSFGSWSGDDDFVTITYIREDESLPNQGLVDGGVAGGLPVDAGKQGKHVEGHNNEGTKKKSKWKEGMNGVKEIQEGWLRGDNIKDRTGKTGTIKEYDTGKVVGDDGKTTKIRVHKDGQTIEVIDSCIMR